MNFKNRKGKVALMAGRDAHEQENTNKKHHWKISLLLFSTSANPPEAGRFCAEAGKRAGSCCGARPRPSPAAEALGKAVAAVCLW